MTNAELYFSTAREREAIRQRRARGQDWPWTTDQILKDWKFCNVFREHDRTTEWFREHVRSKVTGLRAVEATVIFRWFNAIGTGECVEDLLLEGWNRKEAERRLKAMSKVFTGAYIIRSEFGKPKLQSILDIIDNARPTLRLKWPRWGQSLQAAWKDLVEIPYMGGFMAYEVVSDLRWTPVLSGAGDIMTWANAGPGCARGLGYVAESNHELYNHTSAVDQAEMLEVMQWLLGHSREEQYWPQAWAPWEMREVEHWSCELWKYIRCRDHGQPPRSRYKVQA